MSAKCGRDRKRATNFSCSRAWMSLSVRSRNLDKLVSDSARIGEWQFLSGAKYFRMCWSSSSKMSLIWVALKRVEVSWFSSINVIIEGSFSSERSSF
jgi:hypothetical protein